MTTQTLGNISLPNQNKKNRDQEKAPLIHTPKSTHSTHRTQKAFLRDNRIGFLLLLIGFMGAWVYFVPPATPLAVIPFILVLTSIFFILSSFFNAKIQFFSTLFFLLFLSLSYLIGFDLINTIVLLSFIIGLSTLFREKVRE